jgi:hypothetical protein
VPWFVFFVTTTNFGIFNEPQIKRLNIYFENIRILIVCEDLHSKTVTREPNFFNFLSKHVNLEKNKMGKSKSCEKKTYPETFQEESNAVLLPSFPNEEDIFGKETEDLLIDKYIRSDLYLKEPSFVPCEFIWKKDIVCSVENNSVIIKNNDKIKNTLDKNLHSIFYETHSNPLKKGVSKLFKNPKRNSNGNLDCYSLDDHNFQREFDFAKRYSKLVFARVSLNNKKFFIKQSFSSCFKPQIVCLLVYGMILKVQTIALDLSTSNESCYSLDLHFNSNDDLEEAKNALQKFKYLFENPFSINRK